MKKIRFTQIINASRQKVWDTMLNKDTYKQWTTPFNPSSSFESDVKGDWTEGSKIIFTGTDENEENAGGMVSRIAKNVPYEYLSIEHLGILKDGVEDTTSEEAKKWTPAFENYTFSDIEGGTEVVVDMDINDEYAASFEDMWPKALLKLKELAEK